MKRLQLTFYVLLFALPLSLNGQGYTITGTINNIDLNGDKVELTKLEDRNSSIIKDAVVKNNTFSFSGTIDKPALWMLVVDNHKIPFVVDNAKISIAIYPDSTNISGTEVNDEFQKFIDESNAYKKQVTALFSKYQSALEGSAEKESLLKQYEEMEARWQSQVVHYIEGNINNPAGQNAFRSIFSNLSTEELKYILTKVDSSNTQNSIIQKAANHLNVLEKTALGQFYTDVQALDESGKRIALSDYAVKGKYVLLHYWASWCAPCNKSMPDLVAIYDKYQKHGFEIIGVAIERTKKDWTTAIKNLNITWPQMSDLSYWDSNTLKAYGVAAIPYTILIDKEGVIIEKNIQPKELDELLEKLLL